MLSKPVYLIVLPLVFAVGMSVRPATVDAAAGTDAVFSSLYGKWRGKGVISPSAGKPAEKISCKVSYSRLSESVFKASIRCAAVDFKIDASGKVSYSKSSKMFRGNLADRGTGWTLILSGGRTRKSGVRFGLTIPEAKVNGWLSMRIKSKRSHSWFAQRSTSKGLKQLLRIRFTR